MTESLLLKYFKELDSPAVKAFIEHPLRPKCKTSFLNHITYISRDNDTKRIHPPLVNSYQSLVVNPSTSPLKDHRNGDYSEVECESKRHRISRSPSYSSNTFWGIPLMQISQPKLTSYMVLVQYGTKTSFLPKQSTSTLRVTHHWSYHISFKYVWCSIWSSW